MPARTSSTDWGPTGQFPISITNALNETTQLGYDSNFGLLISQTDPNGISSTSHYDSFGRLDTQTAADGTRVTFGYSDCAVAGSCIIGNHGTVITQTIYNADNSVQTDGTTYLDQMNRTLVATSRLLGSGTYRRTETRYDNLGRPMKQAIPCLWSGIAAACPYWQTIAYDVLGRPTQMQRPKSSGDLSLQTTTYSYSGDTVVTTDPQQKQTTQVTTPVGNPASTQDHDGYAINFGYDAFGSLTEISDGLGHTLRTQTYDYGVGAFRRTAADSDQGNSTYQYDALGELVSWTDGNNRTYSQQYDVLSHPTVRSVVVGVDTIQLVRTWGTSRANHNVDKLVSMAGNDCSDTCSVTYEEDYTYDPLGRVIKRSIPTPATGSTTNSYDYSYGTSGLLETMTYPASTSGYRFKLQYGYQNGLLQRISAIADNPAVVVWQATSMNPMGEVTTENYGNGVVTNRAFDAVTGWQSSIQAGIGGGAGVQNQSYLYDQVGNVIQRQNGALGLTENFYYDDVYRLTSSDLLDSHGALRTNLTVHYDLMGNITGRSDVAGGASWNYDPAHPHRLRSAGGTTLNYTNAGEAISRSGDQFVWLPDGLLASVTSPSGASAQFFYRPDDTPLGSQYSDGTNTESTDLIGEQLERVNVNEFRHYVYVQGRPVAIYDRKANGFTGWHYLIGDHQQSIAVITDASGSVTASESFTAFGTRRDAASWSGPATSAAIGTMDAVTRTGYTGQRMFEAVGLVHMNGRVEESTMGRFLSPDPLVPNPSNTQDYNPYSYVDNNPLTLVDPTGFDEGFQENGTITEDASGMSVVTIPGILNGWQTPGLDFGLLSQSLQDYGVTPTSIEFDISSVPRGGGGGAITIGFWHYCDKSGCSTQPHFIPCIYCGFNVGILPSSPAQQVSPSTAAAPAHPKPPSSVIKSGGFSGPHDWSGFLNFVGSPWGGWEGAKSAFGCLWQCGWPGDGSVGGTLDAVAPILPFGAAVEEGSEGLNVIERVAELKAAIPAASEGRVIMAVGLAEDANGARRLLIGTSEPAGYLRPGVALKFGEVLAPGNGHAEEDIVNFAKDAGLNLLEVGATRGICNMCAELIQKAGAKTVTPLRGW